MISGFASNNIVFLIITLIYYLILKPKQTINMYDTSNETNLEQIKSFKMKNYGALAIYFLTVVLTQFLLNAGIIKSNCGDSYSKAMGTAFFITFIPWTLLFGVILFVLSIAPGFKSAFADVVGYFYVSSKANNLLSELLLDREIASKTEEIQSKDEQKAVELAGQTIIKILGSNSLLINQIVPENFINYWNLLHPLKKVQFKNENDETTKKIKEDFFKMVVSRDNVGEALWFIYSGILLTALVQLKITNINCNANPEVMQANYAKFLEEEQKANEQKEKAKTTYELS